MNDLYQGMNCAQIMDTGQPEEKPHICDTCYLIFYSVELCKEHKITCNEAKSVSLLEVNSTELGSNENDVLKEETEEEPHICDTCFLVFESEELCEKHRATCTAVQMEFDDGTKAGIKEDRNHGVNCGENKPLVFEEEHSNAGNILTVVMSHDIIKCELESEEYQPDDALNVGKEPTVDDLGKQCYECGRCEKLFSTETNLKEHYRTHTDEKSYKYNQCYKSFAQMRHLKEHYQTHTGEKTISL